MTILIGYLRPFDSSLVKVRLHSGFLHKNNWTFSCFFFRTPRLTKLADLQYGQSLKCALALTDVAMSAPTFGIRSSIAVLTSISSFDFVTLIFIISLISYPHLT